MSRNFIFSARKQGGSARNLNLRCGLGASKRGFGAHRDLVVFGHGHLPGASCDYLGARIDGLSRGIGRYDLDARGHELLRSSGCRAVGAGRHSLSHDTGHHGFITPKYELRSRANCDYSVSVLLNDTVCCDFAAQNSAKFSGDTYCGSSESTYSRCSSSVGACLRRVGAKQDVHLYCKFGANRDAFPRCGFDVCGLSVQFSAQKAVFSAYRSLFCDASGLGSEQNPALGTFCAVRNFLNLHDARDFKNFGSVNLKKFSLAELQFANLKKQIRAGEGAEKSAEPRNLTNFGRETRVLRRLGFESKILVPRRFYFETALSIPCGSGLRHRGYEATLNFRRSAPDFTENFKNFARSLEVEPVRGFKNQNSVQHFLQGAQNPEQNSLSSSPQNGKSYDQNSAQDFSQSAKNSDRNSKANSMQNQAEPVSPQGSKNSEPCPAQRLGFYAPKFKDERARNFFSHPMRTFVLCACFFAALGALSFLAPDALAIDYVGAHKFYFLFLAPSCIYAAFLLTALPDWANFEGSLKPVSLAFAACLIAAFIASFLNLRLAAAIAALFWAVFFIFAAWLLWLDKNSNNFSILAVLAAFCACSAAYGASGDEKFLLSFVHINVAAIAVVSYRISVVIGNEALREAGLSDAVFIPNFIYKNLAAFLAFALALATPFLSGATCGFIALGIGFLFLAKLRELHYAEILSRHYMAFYYALQAACAAGYAWLGWELIRGGYAAAPLHVIAICYMYGAILFVGMIAGQRHSGISPLNFPRLSRAALVLALLAGGLRAVFAGESFVLYVMIPSALFIAAVALYLINFIPIFLKNPFSADPD